MADYIFLNPSPNMLKIAETVRSMGRDIKLVRNEQFPEINAVNLHMFYDNSFRTVFPDSSDKGEIKPFSRMKKNFLANMTISKIKGELTSVSSDFESADIVDLCLLKREALSVQDISATTVSTATSFNEISSDNENATIVTSYMEFLGGNEKLIMYDTDFDLRDALGSDYFVFYMGGSRLELCASGNRLITVGNKDIDHIEMISDRIKFLKKFNFKRVKELVISRNRMPWVVNNVDKKLVLINDYSFFNISIRMTSQWFEKVGRYICTDKQR